MPSGTLKKTFTPVAEFRRGQVVLVSFPFTDLRSAKLRPAVVLAVHGEDVVVCGVFSTLPPSLKQSWVLIEEKDPAFDRTGLKRSSVIKCEKLATLHRSIVHSAIGYLPQTVLSSVRERVKISLGLG